MVCSSKDPGTDTCISVQARPNLCHRVRPACCHQKSGAPDRQPSGPHFVMRRGKLRMLRKASKRRQTQTQGHRRMTVSHSPCPNFTAEPKPCDRRSYSHQWSTGPRREPAGKSQSGGRIRSRWATCGFQRQSGLLPRSKTLIFPRMHECGLDQVITFLSGWPAGRCRISVLASTVGLLECLIKGRLNKASEISYRLNDCWPRKAPNQATCRAQQRPFRRIAP